MDCMSKLSQEVLPSLVQKFGDDTSALDFRIGIHSGPVTGGVLRGMKSRFQIFGTLCFVFLVSFFGPLDETPLEQPLLPMEKRLTNPFYVSYVSHVSLRFFFCGFVSSFRHPR